MKDVEQWVSWQQGTAADLLALGNRNVRLLLIVSTSHVLQGGQTKPAEPSLPPKTKGTLRDHGQKEKRAEGSFYSPQDEVKQPWEETVTARHSVFESKDQRLCSF